MSYKAGELSLDMVTSFSSIQLKAIDSAVTRLKKLSEALQGFTGVDVTWAKKLASGLDLLSRVDYKRINVGGISAKVSELSKALSPIASPIENVRWVNPFANGLTKLSQLNLDALDVNAITDKLTKLSETISKVAVPTASFDWLSSLGRGLGSIARNFAKIDIDTVVDKLSKLSTSISTVSAPTTSTDWLFTLGKGLGSIARNINKIDFDKFEQGFTKLATAITPFVEKVSSAQSGLAEFNNTMKLVSNKKLDSLGLNEDKGKNLKTVSTLSIFKRVFSIATLRRMGYLLQSLIQYGTDYTETLNMWQVSMRNNLDIADEYIEKMSKAYSVSKNTLMNAQAVFKNMLSNLGNLSEQVSYNLSEGVTQIALDFASLYNTSFEESINKLQAVLSGQTRPIRSISGFDVTEDTLYEVYKNIGGTKAKSALTTIEKRLLSIYATYSQMQSAGAVGDLAKTMENFANQARMVSENFIELKTQVGLFFQELLQSWGLLKKVNAGLIFTTEIIKTLVNYETPNFIDGLFQDTTEATEAMDALNGKLLDFDKIRALNSSSSESSFALDTAVVDALSSYSSVLSTIKNDARELAENWLVKLGLFTFDEKGELVKNQETFDKIRAALVAIAETAGVLVGMHITTKIIKATQALNSFQIAQNLLNMSLAGGLLMTFYSLNRLINDWDDLSTSAKVFNIALLTLGVTITAGSIILKINTAAFVKNTEAKVVNTMSTKQVISSMFSLKKSTAGATLATEAQTKAMKAQKAMAIGLAVVGIGLLSYSLAELTRNFDKMDTAEKVSKIFYAISGAALAAAGAIGVLKGIANPWSIGLSIAAIAGLTAATIAAQKSLTVDKHALGASDIDGGSLFIAGEAGKTEMVYSGQNGKSNVANIKQIREAQYQGQKQALNEWWSSAKNDIPSFKGASSTNLYELVDSEARKRGRSFAKK